MSYTMNAVKILLALGLLVAVTQAASVSTEQFSDATQVAPPQEDLDGPEDAADEDVENDTDDIDDEDEDDDDYTAEDDEDLDEDELIDLEMEETAFNTIMDLDEKVDKIWAAVEAMQKQMAERRVHMRPGHHGPGHHGPGHHGPGHHGSRRGHHGHHMKRGGK